MKIRAILAMGVLLISVLSQQSSLAQQSNGTRTFIAPPPISPWTFMGPQPISDQSSSVGQRDGQVGPPPLAGRVSAVAVVDANTVYIGTSGGGVWKTTDGGYSWKP